MLTENNHKAVLFRRLAQFNIPGEGREFRLVFRISGSDVIASIDDVIVIDGICPYMSTSFCNIFRISCVHVYLVASRAYEVLWFQTAATTNSFVLQAKFVSPTRYSVTASHIVSTPKTNIIAQQ